MNLGNHYDSIPRIPLKRRRGHHRNDLSFISERISDGPLRSQSHIHGGRAYGATGYGMANGNQPHQVDALGDLDDAVVGVAITGVIEGTFDAGYLLSVRVGDSDNYLKGVVFRPGHYVPVSAENDVAPHVQMIRRNEVPVSSDTQTPVHGDTRNIREINQHAMVLPLSLSPPPNQLAKHKGKHVSTAPARRPPPIGSRGTVIPVILQPGSISNGALASFEAPPVTSQPAHLATSKGKKPYPLGDHGLPSPQEVTPKISQTYDGSTSQSTEAAIQIDNCAGKLPLKRFDQLVKEEMGTPSASGSVKVQDNNAKSAGMTSSKASELTPEQIWDFSQPLLVQPLQAIRSDAPYQSPSVCQPRKGKMTELLMVVQQNSVEKH